MPSHPKKNFRLPTEATKTPSIQDGQRNIRQNSNWSHYLSNSNSSHSQQGPTVADNTSRGLVSRNSSNDEEKGGGGGGGDDDGEADEENGNSRDGDVIAPSGSAIHGDENQAGHIRPMELERSLAINNHRKHTSSSHRDKESIYLSDDDDYNGVDLITDSEEGFAVEQLEERMIIDSEDVASARRPLTRISSDGGGYDVDQDLFLSDAPYFDQSYARTEPEILANEIDTFSSRGFFENNIPPLRTIPSRRRVRFAGPKKLSYNAADHDASYSEENEESTPSVPKDKLPLSICHTIDKDKYPGRRLKKKNVESQLILNNEEQCAAGAHVSDNCDDEESVFQFQVSDDDSSDGSDGSRSGYESDDSDFTEEEAVPPFRPQALLRRLSISPVNDVIPTSTSLRQQTQNINPSIRGPTKGSWPIGPTRQFTVLTPGERMLIVQANQQPENSTDHISPRFSLQVNIPYITDQVWNPAWPNQLLVPRETCPSIYRQTSGSPEPFMPFEENGSDFGGFEDFDTEHWDEGEEKLDLMQFINYSDESEEDEAEKDDFLESTSDATLSFNVDPQATFSDDTSDSNLLGTAAPCNQNHNPASPYDSQDTLEEHRNHVFPDSRSVDDAAASPLGPLRKRRLSNGFGDGGSFSPPEIALKRRALNPC